MKTSKKFMDKFVGDTMKGISSKGFFYKLFYYMTDSKNRTYQRLDKFLAKQIDNPDEELVMIAKQFWKYTDPDVRIIKILEFVNKKIKYTSDKRNFDKIELWADAYVTWAMKRDDCDGINALIYVLARFSGIPALILWSVIGMTKDGGHYWLIYFSPRKERWYSIDGTYYVSLQAIKTRPQFTLSEKYQEIWYLFNEAYSYKAR